MNENIETKVETLRPFTRFLITIGELPTSYLMSMTYYEQIIWFTKYLQEKVIPAINNNAEAVKELQELFKELQEYVNNYFENLDVQEEINNKIDEMAEDGTLADIINQELYNINSTTHFVYRGQNGGDCSVIQTKDKNIIIDFGKYEYITQFILYLINNNITKIDYVILSHMDADHTGTLTGFMQVLENPNLDFSDCTFITHQAPDWTTYTGDLTYQDRYEAIINYLTSNNYRIKYPTELEEIELDYNNKLKFYNVNTDLYQYYTTLSANAFSVVTELITNNNNLLFTGDLLEECENLIYNELNEVDLLKVPHHNVESTISRNFLKKINPKTGVIMNTTVTYPNRPLYHYFMDSHDRQLYTSNESENIIVKSIGNKLKITSTNGAYSINYNNTLIQNEDLNDIRKDGKYICNSDSVAQTLLNIPYNYQSQFILNVEEITINHVIQTIKTLNTDNIVWTRKYVNGSWSTWQKYRISTFNYLKAKLSSQFNVANNSWNKLPFDTIVESSIINEALSLDNTTGDIKIGKGVHHVRVTANAVWNGLTADDRVNISIYKNTTRVIGCDEKSYGSPKTQNCSCILSVVENNTISLQVRNLNSTTSKLSNNDYDTILEVSVID